MDESSNFQDLIRQVRAGDEAAALRLVRRYEKAIRLAVHVRLTDPGLRRFLDSVDICQSVLASFFVRVAAGQYELNTPEQLLSLLTTMARNKLLRQVKKQRAQRRDYRRTCQDLSQTTELAADTTDPGQLVASQELLGEVQRRLSAEERWLAEQRSLNRSWDEIAAENGGNANTLRSRLDRAIDRVTRELGLEV